MPETFIFYKYITFFSIQDFLLHAYLLHVSLFVFIRDYIIKNRKRSYNNLIICFLHQKGSFKSSYNIN